MRTAFLVKSVLVILMTVNGLNAMAQIVAPQSGYYRLRVGTVEVIALSDGTVPVNAMELFHDALQPERVSHLLKDAYLNDEVEVSINAYLIKTPGKLILVDAGAGELFGPKHGGKLVASLRTAGYGPEQITDILITHVHLDHSGGLTRNDSILFPKAVVHVNKKEINFWLKHTEPQQNEMRGITANRSSFIALKRYLDKGMLRTFEGDTTLFAGISTREFVGHTPGHTVFVLESQNEKLVFWGDLIHIAEVQLHGPELYNGFDFDKQKAVRQRRLAYEEAAAEGYLIAADHISFPGIGRLRRSEKGANWVPMPYSVLKLAP